MSTNNKVTEINGTRNVRAVIVAKTEEDAEALVKTYLERYNPFGYGTKVVKKDVSEDQVRIELVRFNSCD
jgi:hypothetical protein